MTEDQVMRALLEKGFNLVKEGRQVRLELLFRIEVLETEIARLLDIIDDMGDVLYEFETIRFIKGGFAHEAPF